MPSHKILKIAPTHHPLKNSISKELGVSGNLAQILVNRGIKNISEAEKFLRASLSDLHHPYLFSQMQEALRLVREQAQKKDNVLIFGDYDVDGVTSVTLLKETLTKAGLKAHHYLPHRIKEGYGLNKNILQLVKQHSASLLITADCGINSHQEIDELRRHNIEVIVTDHHEPVVPGPSPASCVINPKVAGCNYPYRDLAGVGVAFKFAQALLSRKLFDDLDLVTLGTVADVVPLTGENRIIVKEGLKKISSCRRIGLNALIESSGIKDKKVTCGFISYILGPRLNASGRMDRADISLDLLLAKKKEKADELAESIEKHNRERQKIESGILREAEDLINKEVNFKEHKVIVLAGDNWHQGVLGVVASKIADRFWRPTILISRAHKSCKGSGRSIRSFHLLEALTECKDILDNFGGHSHAVGLVIDRDKIGDFRRRINDFAFKKLRLEDLLPSLEVDMELSLSDLNEGFVAEIERLEPFGADNPQPLFFTRSLRLKSEPQVLGRDTLKFWVTDGSINHQCIAFRMGSARDSLKNAEKIDLVYSLKLDSWAGIDSMLLEVKDIFFS
ncbi:MAG: single-stranded-DNA-specific exonuclease RecJ [Candidatus Omnitrophica bacterium]|nr:single-stranded-DNA-specific exonuclease RecJ [Candidatus Omnitrophota bacterium]